MRPVSVRRKEFMATLTKAMDLLEGGRENSKLYKEKFEKMTDEEFDRYITQFFEDENANFYLEIVEFERDLKMDNITKCAEFLGVPLYERVAVPDATGDSDEVVVTPFPVPVGYAHYKRMQQTIRKKNSTSIHNAKRNSKTNQVTGSDKTAKNTDVETYAMMSMGAYKGLSELMGPRADDTEMKNQMLSQISQSGFARMEDLESDPINKVSLNTLNMYFILQGFCTNLVSPLYTLPKPKKVADREKERDEGLR